MKSLIKILIPTLLIALIIAIGYDMYKETTPKITDPLTIIPKNSAIILQINNIKEIPKTLKQTNIWNQLLLINQFELINKELDELSLLLSENSIFNTTKMVVSLHKTGPNNNNILYSTNISLNHLKDKNNIIPLIGQLSKTYKYDKKTVYELNKKEKTIYCSFEEDIIFFSKNKMLIEDVIKKNKTTDKLLNSDNFKTLYSTINNDADINLFINYNSLSNFINTYTKENTYLNNLSEWVLTDVKIKNNVIIANGFSNLKEPIKQYSDIFINQQIQNIDIVNIIPENTTILLGIGFDKSKLLLEKKNKLLQLQNNFWSWNKYRKKILDSTKVDYHELIKDLGNEAGKFNTFNIENSNAEYAYFKSNNTINTASIMQGLIIKKEKYNNYYINSCKDHNIIENLFGPIFSCKTAYFTNIEDYFIFGNSQASIQYIIDNYNTKKTLNYNASFRKYRRYMSSKTNLLFYINPGRTINELQDQLEEKYKKKILFNNDSIKNFTGLSIDISSKRDLLLNNLSIYYDSNFKENIKEEWFLQLDTSIAMRPQFVKNHFTNEKMILIQTLSNNLYAIDKKGRIVWEKKLNSKIIGDINEIDIYKNKKYQAIFNTVEKIHIIDRNGNYVDGFPKKTPQITNLGHALFDYENKKRYRILITGEDNIIYNVNSKIEKVQGWKYKKEKNRIIATPRHFKVNNKDYILEETANSTSRLLAINGTKRVSYNSKTTFNRSPLQIGKNGTIYAITSEGKLWRGKTNGDVTETSIDQLNNQSLFCIINNQNNNEEYVLTNDQKLIITDINFQKTHDFELNQKITQLFTVKDYILSSTSDELYLYKNKEIIEGFPIETDGLFNFTDIENNGKMNIINSKHGTIYNYEIKL